MKITAVNGSDRGWTKHRYILSFDGTVLMVWANSLNQALDEAVDWIADHAPGILADEAVQEAYLEALASGMTEEEAQSEAEMDTTCAGNNGHYLNSWEWGIVAEDPSRTQVLELLGV